MPVKHPAGPFCGHEVRGLFRDFAFPDQVLLRGSLFLDVLVRRACSFGAGSDA
jgi:hypothetical protein